MEKQQEKIIFFVRLVDKIYQTDYHVMFCSCRQDANGFNRVVEIPASCSSNVLFMINRILYNPKQ